MAEPTSGAKSLKEQFWDPVAGFGVTFRTMFKKVVTEQYPFEKMPTAPRFHGRHQLNRWPDGLEKCIEGNIVQGVSRTLWEEVKFDAKTVTSVDWMTYPILDITETPETIDVVAINRPDTAPTGAGEPSIRPIAAAIANAIFDATGVRIRRVPFSPDRVKQALS